MREQEEQQQHEHQIESEETGSVQRPKAGESRVWELGKLKSLAALPDTPSVADESALFAFPSFAKIAEIFIGCAGAGANAAKTNPVLASLAECRLRFSPNSRVTVQVPIVKPVLVALELRGNRNPPTTVALSLAEAESLRWALAECESKGQDFRFSLYVISESPMFDKDVTMHKAGSPFLQSKHNQVATNQLASQEAGKPHQNRIL